jgi:hypothetical protein
MKTKEQLRAEISSLMVDLVRNGVHMRTMIRWGNVREQLNLMAARVEILKSICHRQGQLIQLVDMGDEIKEAA